MKKTTILLSSLIFTLGLSLSNVSSAKEWKTVRIAVDSPYEPFEYKNEEGKLTGFEVDLGNAVCKEIKAKCEWIIQSWDGIIPGLLARKYDVIFSSMSITPERAKKVLFSKPYYNTPSGWFVKKGTLTSVTPAALKGKRIGVQRGTTQDNYVTKHFTSVATIKRYTTADDLTLDLRGGRLDAVLVDYPVGEKTILTDSNFITIGDKPKLGEGIGAAFRKRDKDLAAKFNAALEKLKKNGTYDKIMKKYFTYSVKM
jgi:arginine/ornithine transport system substrate-binding protein